MSRSLRPAALLAASLSCVVLQAQDGTPEIQLARAIPGHDAPVQEVIASHDGHWVVTRDKGPSRVLRIWEAGKGELHSQTPFPGFVSGSLALSHSSEFIAFGYGASIVVREFPALTGTRILSCDSISPKVPVTGLAYTPDDKGLISIHKDGNVGIWDVETGEQLCSWYPHGRGRRVHHVATTLDGTRMATCGDDGVRLWETASQHLLHQINQHGKAVVHVAFSPDGAHLATAGRDFRAAVWDVETGKNLAWLRGHRQSVWRVHFLPNPDYLMTGSMDKSLRIWRWVESKEVANKTCKTCVTMYSDISSDGTVVVSAGGEHPYANRVTDEKDYAVRLWRLPDDTLTSQQRQSPSFPIARLRRQHLARPPEAAERSAEDTAGTSIVTRHQSGAPQITWNHDETRLRIDRSFRSFEYEMKDNQWRILPEHRHYLRVGSEKRVYLSYRPGDADVVNDSVPVAFVTQTGTQSVTRMLPFHELVQVMEHWNDGGGSPYNGDVVRILRGLEFFLSSDNRSLLVPIGGTGEYGDPNWNTFLFDTQAGVAKRYKGVFVPRNRDPFQPDFSLFDGDPPDFHFRGVRWDSHIHDNSVVVTRQGKVVERGEIYRNGYYRLGNDPWRSGNRAVQLNGGGTLQLANSSTGPCLYRYTSDFDTVASIRPTPHSGGMARVAAIHSSPTGKWHFVVGALGADYVLLNEQGRELQAWWSRVNLTKGVYDPPKPVMD